MSFILCPPLAMTSFVEVGGDFLIWWILLPAAILYALALLSVLILALFYFAFVLARKLGLRESRLVPVQPRERVYTKNA